MTNVLFYIFKYNNYSGIETFFVDLHRSWIAFRHGGLAVPRNDNLNLDISIKQDVDSVILSLLNHWYKIGDWEGDNNKN